MRVATPRTAPHDDDTESMGRNWALPNVPIQPMNGMIRTYDNQQRTFSRPYSAKTVFFYKEGDEYFTGVRVPISKSRYRTIDTLLDDLNRNIPMPFGVRRLTTPMGRTPIKDIEQLEHLGKYVASSSRFSRGINLSALERLKKARSLAESSLRKERAGGQSFWIPTSPSLPQQMRLQRHLGLGTVIPSKQIFFVLNGKGRFYRTLLNPLRLPSMEQLLIEVSEGLEVAIHRVYSSDGMRITNVHDMLHLTPPKLIACPRNERPTLRESVQLPAINPNRYTHRSSKTGTNETTTSSSSLTNGIEKPRRVESHIRRNTRRTTGAPKKRMPPLPPLVAPRKVVSSLPDEGDSGKANSISSYDTSKIEEDRHSSDYPETEETLPSTSYDAEDRPRSTLPNGHVKHKISIHSDHTEDEVMEHSPSSSTHSNEEQDYIQDSESRPGTKGSRRRSSTKQIRRDSHKLEDTSEKEEDTISRKSSASRNGTACSQHEEILKSDDENESRPETIKEHDEEVIAVIEKIQSRKSSIMSEREEILPSEMTTRQNTARSRIESARLSRKSSICSQKEAILPSAHTSRQSTAQSLEEILPSDDEDKRIGYRQQTVVSEEEEELPSGESEESPKKVSKFNNEDEAATKIQAAFRGFHTRKKLKNVGFANTTPEVINPNEMKSIDMDAPVIEVEELVESRVATPFPAVDTEANYTIAVMTGNRWGADTEAELYIYIHGKEGVSPKIALKHENPEPRFRQNQLDLFYENCDPLGTLTKIIIGHTRKGYGAGVFIDYVTITENTLDGRQFLFSIRKWLDGGQVDGKIERLANLSAIYFMDSFPDEIESHGRWQFMVYNGTLDGQGGTNSDLIITGYGSRGSSICRVENDNTMQEVPDKTLIQVDFGNIGDLIKVRFETDPLAERPNFYIDFVELTDMDTEERLLVRMGKWIDHTKTKKSQPFREIAVFRPEQLPLPMITYDGKIAAKDLDLLESDVVSGELIGEFDTGKFPMIYDKGKKEFTFKVDCVYMGQVKKVKITGDFSETGKAVMEGMSVLQDIWDSIAPGVSVAAEVIGASSLVRESSHCPYRYVLGQSKVEELNDTEPYFKVLCITGMEGLSTRNKRESRPVGVDAYQLEMSVQGTKVPDVWIVKGQDSEQMTLISSEDESLQFEIQASKLESVEKVRISIGRLEENSGFSVYKMRLRNTLTGAEMRFSFMNTEFAPYQVLEFSTVFPDIPPKPNVLYTLKIRTKSVKGKVKPKLKLIGSESDSGIRSLGEKTMEVGHEMFDMEAVNLGTLTAVEVEYEGDAKSSWQFDVTVTQTDVSVDYTTKTGIMKKPGKKRLLLKGIDL